MLLFGWSPFGNLQGKDGGWAEPDGSGGVGKGVVLLAQQAFQLGYENLSAGKGKQAG